MTGNIFILILLFKKIQLLHSRGNTIFALFGILQFTRTNIFVLLNIMFHTLMGRFQLELFIFITYFLNVVPLTSCVFFPVGLSSLTNSLKGAT